MKLLYIANYKDGTGYSNAAIDYILAADAAGIDIVPRNLKLSDKQYPVPDRILELEKKESHDCDYCIQHTLPHLFSYDGRFKKCIGLFATETSSIGYSSWPNSCNQMDEIWVINKDSQLSVLSGPVVVPTKIVPHAINLDKCRQGYKKLDIPELNNNYNFYVIGEINRRKNLRMLIEAFHLAFEPEESVNLVIKASKGNAEQSYAMIKELCDTVKTNLKLRHNSLYKQEIIIPGRLSDEEIMSLHQSCQCFVCTSYGEAWNIPAMEAWAFGNHLIAPDYQPFADLKNNVTLVQTHLEPTTGMTDIFQDLYTGYEQWHRPDINELVDAMQNRFFEPSNYNIDYMAESEQFSYTNIGNLIKETLCS